MILIHWLKKTEKGNALLIIDLQGETGVHFGWSLFTKNYGTQMIVSCSNYLSEPVDGQTSAHVKESTLSLQLTNTGPETEQDVHKMMFKKV